MVDTIDSAQTAAQADNVSLLEAIFAVEGRAVCGSEDPDVLTTLHFAAASGSLDAVRFLCSDAVGADVSAARNNNFTPLHAAAMNGHLEVCRVLLEAGASPNVQTEPQGYVPLHSAAWAGHIGVIEVLLAAEARTDLRNHRGETPAQTALRQGNSAAAQRLQAEGIADDKALSGCSKFGRYIRRRIKLRFWRR